MRDDVKVLDEIKNVSFMKKYIHGCGSDGLWAGGFVK